ncbi:MAG: tyrosine-protein phosphatase [Clostridia bacterium]|nr:tyrosine-protein phosphatase [Clostridia bacterium]
MRRMRMLVLAAVLIGLLALSGAAFAEITACVTEIAKYGNLVLDINGAQLLADGVEYGDLLDVTILGKTLTLPLGSNYSDVDTGMPVVRAEAPGEAVTVAVNMGDFATTAGIAVKHKTEEEPGYRWEYLTELPVRVTLTLAQASGYRNQWLIRQLVRTNERTDYAHLSDEAFANFRMVDTAGMGKGKLYRSSSPINPEIGRSAYADAAARAAGIATVINLADASNTYETPEGAYYPGCRVVYLNLGVDFEDPAFKEGVAEGLRFIIAEEAPYLVHCSEGKDRAGFVSALLECLMGAAADEVIADYMETYVNYYGVEPGTEKYDAVVSSNIVKALETAFHVEDLHAADLAAEAEAFLLEELGLSAEETDALRDRLGE